MIQTKNRPIPYMEEMNLLREMIAEHPELLNTSNESLGYSSMSLEELERLLREQQQKTQELVVKHNS